MVVWWFCVSVSGDVVVVVVCVWWCGVVLCFCGGCGSGVVVWWSCVEMAWQGMVWCVCQDMV